jgi:hypothetical protein
MPGAAPRKNFSGFRPCSHEQSGVGQHDVEARRPAYSANTKLPQRQQALKAIAADQRRDQAEGAESA